jgi:hypothetical protein
MTFVEDAIGVARYPQSGAGTEDSRHRTGVVWDLGASRRRPARLLLPPA